MRFAESRRAQAGTTTPVLVWQRALALLATHAFLLGNVALSARSIGWFAEPARFALAIAVASSAWALRGARAAEDRRRFGSAVLLLALAWVLLSGLGLAAGRATMNGGFAVSLGCRSSAAA